MYLWQIEYNSLSSLNCISIYYNKFHNKNFVFNSKVRAQKVRTFLVLFGPFFYHLNLYYNLSSFLFFAAKRETEKLAAADKYAKIMILSLNKKNSLRSNSFLFLTLKHHNFLTLFIQGGRGKPETKDSA